MASRNHSMQQFKSQITFGILIDMWFIILYIHLRHLSKGVAAMRDPCRSGIIWITGNRFANPKLLRDPQTGFHFLLKTHGMHFNSKTEKYSVTCHWYLGEDFHFQLRCRFVAYFEFDAILIFKSWCMWKCFNTQAQTSHKHINIEFQHLFAGIRRTIQPQTRSREAALTSWSPNGLASSKNGNSSQSTSIFTKQLFHRCGLHPGQLPMQCYCTVFSPLRG